MFNKIFDEKIKNQSDYGIGVVFENLNNKPVEYLIKYDHDSDSTDICYDKIDDILCNITQNDFFFQKCSKFDIMDNIKKLEEYYS